MDGLKNVYLGRVLFIRVNILDASNKPLMAEYGFTATPEIFLTDDHANILSHWDDFVPSDELESVIDRALKQTSAP